MPSAVSPPCTLELDLSRFKIESPLAIFLSTCLSKNSGVAISGVIYPAIGCGGIFEFSEKLSGIGICIVWKGLKFL